MVMSSQVSMVGIMAHMSISVTMGIHKTTQDAERCQREDAQAPETVHTVLPVRKGLYRSECSALQSEKPTKYSRVTLYQQTVCKMRLT